MAYGTGFSIFSVSLFRGQSPYYYHAVMHHIRPYRFFTLFDASIPDRMVQAPLPSRRWSGGISLLETFLLIAAARVVSAKRIFEFGTFLGSTTLNLALNSPEDATVFTLDLDQDSARGLSQDVNDAPLTGMHLSAASNLDFADSTVRHKIETIFGNSRSFDASPWAGSIDLAFIDGGHDVPTASCDTENAFRMARQERPSCLVWHDYGNREYAALTDYLEELSQRVEMFHIEDTMLCVCFQGAHNQFRSHLLNPDTP